VARRSRKWRVGWLASSRNSPLYRPDELYAHGMNRVEYWAFTAVLKRQQKESRRPAPFKGVLVESGQVRVEEQPFVEILSTQVAGRLQDLIVCAEFVVQTFKPACRVGANQRSVIENDCVMVTLEVAVHALIKGRLLNPDGRGTE